MVNIRSRYHITGGQTVSIRGHLRRTKQRVVYIDPTYGRRLKKTPHAQRIDERMEELRRRYGNRCSVCEKGVETGSPLEFAHLKETGLSGQGRSKQYRVADITKNPTSYTLMHKDPCHRNFDRTCGPEPRALPLSERQRAFAFMALRKQYREPRALSEQD